MNGQPTTKKRQSVNAKSIRYGKRRRQEVLAMYPAKTSQQLAEETGIHLSTINRWIRLSEGTTAPINQRRCLFSPRKMAEIVSEANGGQATQVATAKKYGVSLSTLNRWQADARRNARKKAASKNGHREELSELKHRNTELEKEVAVLRATVRIFSKERE